MNFEIKTAYIGKESKVKDWRCKFDGHLLAKIKEEAVKQVLQGVGVNRMSDSMWLIEIKCPKCKTMNKYYLSW